jgi:hypothetical protein
MWDTLTHRRAFGSIPRQGRPVDPARPGEDGPGPPTPPETAAVGARTARRGVVGRVVGEEGHSLPRAAPTRIATDKLSHRGQLKEQWEEFREPGDTMT